MESAPQINLEDSKHRPGFFALLLWLVAAVLLYVLSSGPFLMFEYSTGKPGLFSNPFYTPVVWLYQNTALQKPLGMYYHLWLPQFYGSRGEMLLTGGSLTD